MEVVINPELQTPGFFDLNMLDCARNGSTDGSNDSLYRSGFQGNNHEVLLRPKCVSSKNGCHFMRSTWNLEQLQPMKIPFKRYMRVSCQLFHNLQQETVLVTDSPRLRFSHGGSYHR